MNANLIIIVVTLVLVFVFFNFCQRGDQPVNSNNSLSEPDNEDHLLGSSACNHASCICSKLTGKYDENGFPEALKMGRIKVPTHLNWHGSGKCRMKKRDKYCGVCEDRYGKSRYGYVLSECTIPTSGQSLHKKCYVCDEASAFCGSGEKCCHPVY